MVNELFQTVLGMSLTGAVVILLVLLARLILRGAPKVFSYALWAVVLARLLCPFTPESALSLVPSARIVEVPGIAGTTAEILEVSTGIPAVDDGLNDFFAAHPYQGYVPAELPPDGPLPVVPQTGDVPDWRTVPAVLWLTGGGVLLAYSAVSLVRLRRRLVGAVPLEGESGVLLADHIDAPFVLGLFRPRIYLPSALPEGEREYVLLHERTHIRRLDHLTRALAWLTLCLHWFNPLAWLAFHLAGRDMETSCDEAVLRRVDRDVRADYAASLLRLSAGKKLPVGPLAFGDGDPEGRIKNVLNYKKPAFWVVVVALVAVVAAGVVLITGRPFAARNDTPSDPPAYDLDELTYVSGPKDDEITIHGLDAGETRWQPDLDGFLYAVQPRFLNLDFISESGGKIQLCASYDFSEDHRSLSVRFHDINDASDSGEGFVVDFPTGTAELYQPSGALAGRCLSQAEMLAVARALDEIMRSAEGFYAAQGPAAG